MTSSKRPGKSAPLQEVAVEKLRVASAWLRDYITAIKYGHLHPFTSMERKVREATRNEPWGPTGTMLNELAEASHNSTDCEIIFAVIQLRLGYPPEKWRNVYKALVLLDFLILRGSEQSMQITKEELMYKLEDLETFAYTSPEGKDHGVNVRHRAKSVKELMLDNARLRAERQAFGRKRRAYQGFTRDQLASRSDWDIPSPTSAHEGLRRTLSDSSMRDSRHSSFAGDVGLNDFATTAPNHYRNAGETKGVTMAMNKKQLAELKQLLDLPENRYCADCIGGGGAARASWASINNGVFLCMRCAGVHRGLGTHISKVRSCTLDTWLPEQVAFMAQIGNERANSYFEAKLDADLKPAYGSVDLEPFIRRKYAVRAYAEGSWPPPELQVNSMTRVTGSATEEQPEEQGGQSGMPDIAGINASNAVDPALDTKKGVPRLQSRKPARQGSSRPAAKPLTRLVSVPLPSSAPALPSAQAASVNPVMDLMAFGSGEIPHYSAPAKSLIQPQHQNDVFADLETLMPSNSNSLLDNNVQIGSTSLPALQESVPLSFSDPPVLSAFTQARQPAVAPHQAAANGSPQLSTWQHPQALSGSQPMLQQAHIGQHGGVQGFAGESVQDWGQPDTNPSKSRLSRLHVHSASIGGESDQGSVASTPFLTPRLTALFGPGPTHNALQSQQPQAPRLYVPPDVANSLRAAQAQQSHISKPASALMQATKQWTANSKQGEKGVLDELVLHAMAGLPPPKHGNLQEALAARQAPKPPSMLQQRAIVQQLLT